MYSWKNNFVAFLADFILILWWFRITTKNSTSVSDYYMTCYPYSACWQVYAANFIYTLFLVKHNGPSFAA